MLAALDRPRRSLAPYLAHLSEIEEAMRAEAGMMLRVTDGARSLVELLVARLGYDGDRMEYDDPRNADLMAVIDRRRGLPVALGILYMHAARAAGMLANGLNTQSHFVLRLSHRGDELTIDPFHGGQTVDREHLPVELRPDDAGLAQLVSDTDVLLRLQNNLKMRGRRRARLGIDPPNGAGGAGAARALVRSGAIERGWRYPRRRAQRV
jgi:regulator of sirC expression with transglutaminase-like and TPR domain